jgi:PBSX family phage terminase large subunit
MTHQVKISDIVAVPHLKHFNSDRLHQVKHGGRGSFKSSANSLKIAMTMLQDPHCEVVVIRQDYSDHKTSTFSQLKWAFEVLGVPLQANVNYPLGNDLWIKLPQGNYVHFKQMKEIDKLKGILPNEPKNDIKIVWFFEITQFKSEWYINEAIASFVRKDKDYIYFLYEYNNHPKLSHWTYKWLETMKKSDDCYVQKVNYNDAPEEQQRKFLGRIALKEIERLKQVDPEQYKNTYLGLPANLAGSVYKQFDRSRHVKPPSYEYADVWVGVDFGGNDATTFTATGLRYNYAGIEVFDTYYHKNGQDGIKTINDYTHDLIQFCQMIYAKTKKNISVYIDPANLTFKQLVEEQTYKIENKFIFVESFLKKSSDKNKTSVQERIDLTEIMFGSDFVSITPKADKLIAAIEQAEYNNKNERADDGRSDIDSLDSFEYSWLKEKKIIRDIILGGI